MKRIGRHFSDRKDYRSCSTNNDDNDDDNDINEGEDEKEAIGMCLFGFG